MTSALCNDKEAAGIGEPAEDYSSTLGGGINEDAEQDGGDQNEDSA